MLDNICSRFSALLSDPTEERGQYFPDSIIPPFLNAARQSLPKLMMDNLVSIDNSDVAAHHVSLHESKEIILAAFGAFAPELGKRARAIFDAGFDEAVNKAEEGVSISSWDNPPEPTGRWRIKIVLEGQARMGRCLPACSPASQLGPENPQPSAVIDLEYDDTLYSTIVLAHEIGHGIADDMAREHYRLGSGARLPTFKQGGAPDHMAEIQAYLPQLIVNHFLLSDPNTHAAALQAFKTAFVRWDTKQHYLSEIAAAGRSLAEIDAGSIPTKEAKILIVRLHDRPISLLSALVIYQAVQPPNQDRRTSLLTSLYGASGPKNVVEVFATAGIENQEDLQKAAHQASDSSVDGLSALTQPIVAILEAKRPPTRNRDTRLEKS